VIVPVSDGVPQAPPVVVIVYGNVPTVLELPEIVTVFAVVLAVIPVGNPVTVAPVAVPPKVYVILVIVALAQTVWVLVAGAEVRVNVANGCTVIVPVNDGVPQAPPVVVIVYGNVPTALGLPEMVTVLPVVLALTPAGNPVTVAPVAVPPKSYVILVIGAFKHTVCEVVAGVEVSVNVANGCIVIVPVNVGAPQAPPVVAMV